MDLVIILSGLLTIGMLYFIVEFVKDLVKNKEDLGDSNPILGFFIGFITDFLDTLGIGSFVMTILFSRLTGFVKNDKLLPGTLNIGHTIPVLIEALLFISVVKVDGLTLLSLISAAVLGSILGARIVTKLPEKKIQIAMGICLIMTAGVMLARQKGWIELAGVGNTSLKLTGIFLIIAIIGNFILGALMMVGVGLYAPCLAMVSLLGMDPKGAFPIMMCSCAALMIFSSPKFIKEGLYPRKGTAALAVGGALGVIVAVTWVKSMSLSMLTWIIICVVVIAGLDMLRKGFMKVKV